MQLVHAIVCVVGWRIGIAGIVFDTLRRRGSAWIDFSRRRVNNTSFVVDNPQIDPRRPRPTKSPLRS